VEYTVKLIHAFYTGNPHLLNDTISQGQGSILVANMCMLQITCYRIKT